MKIRLNKLARPCSKSNHWIIYPILLLFLIQGACSQTTSPYDELVNRGFYAFILPDDVLIEQGWTLYTPIKEEKRQWNIHCKGGIDAPENPLVLNYLDEEKDLQMSIWISHRGSMWDHNNFTENVSLNTIWSKTNEGLVYKNQPFSPIRFEDIYGNQVIIRGDLPVSEKISLINKLEYYGPQMKDFMNPWSAEWCSKN